MMLAEGGKLKHLPCFWIADIESFLEGNERMNSILIGRDKRYDLGMTMGRPVVYTNWLR